ncbi:MAG: response regulator transcription factor [Candidatus Omnitrophica bacterium]|nr:response regulator transcription factor [Candidatus Omnitrophota bacterium]
MRKRKILIVEDEKELVKLIAFHMTIAGYEVFSANDGIEALETCKADRPDLIILDIMLPKIDGWEVCRRLKLDPKTSNIPIIILSALQDIDDKLKGFYLGSDDYVTKPFSPRELVVRVKRVLTRSEIRSSLPKIIRTGSLEINLEDISVKRDNQEILLTEKEKGILKFLVSNPERVLTHSEIMDEVWGKDNIVEFGNIDVHIRHLREKLEKDPENPKLIKTVKGEGYKFEL